MQEVKIEMTINPVALMFGMPIMLTAIILGTLFVSHLSAPAVHVAAPNVSVAAAPTPNVTANLRAPEVTVNVPQNPAPVVNVAAPLGEPSRVSLTLPGGTEVRTVKEVIEKPVVVEKYVYVDTREKASITMDDVIASAEKYLQRSGFDMKKWGELWGSRVKERGDEQALFNECLVEKRGAFKADAKATEVQEICALLVRLREAKLAVPEIAKSYISAANLAALKLALDGR